MPACVSSSWRQLPRTRTRQPLRLWLPLFVKDTVRRVAGLPDYLLDDQELFEGFALEAFELAAAANLPHVLPAEAYREAPRPR